MFLPCSWISWINALSPLSLAGVLSHLTLLRTMLPSAERVTESPGELGVFEGRQVLGEDEEHGEGWRRAGVGRGGKH